MAIDPEIQAELTKWETRQTEMTASLQALTEKLDALETKDPEDKRLPALQEQLEKTQQDLVQARKAVAGLLKQQRPKKSDGGDPSDQKPKTETERPKTASGLPWL